jgi:hypothetical protein
MEDPPILETFGPSLETFRRHNRPGNPGWHPIVDGWTR